MRRWAINAVATASLAGGSCQAAAQVPHILGTWALNAEDSQLPGGVPEGASDTRVYYLREDGYRVGLAVMTRPDGPPNFLQFAAKSDGEEYPEYETNTLAELQVSGESTPMTYSETIVDEYTVEVTDRRDGRVTGQGTRSVSPDGQTMTVRFPAQGQDGQQIPIVLVYDRVAEPR